jgi:ribosomal protein S20
MTLKEINMLKKNLLYIEDEINKVFNSNVMEKAVKSRLKSALKKYTQNLEDTCKYLASKSPKKVIKVLEEQIEEKIEQGGDDE